MCFNLHVAPGLHTYASSLFITYWTQHRAIFTPMSKCRCLCLCYTPMEKANPSDQNELLSHWSRNSSKTSEWFLFREFIMIFFKVLIHLPNKCTRCLNFYQTYIFEKTVVLRAVLESREAAIFNAREKDLVLPSSTTSRLFSNDRKTSVCMEFHICTRYNDTATKQL